MIGANISIFIRISTSSLLKRNQHCFSNLTNNVIETFKNYLDGHKIKAKLINN